MYKRVGYLGMMLGISLILSYVETLIPFNFGIPGIKLGLANVVSVYILFSDGCKEAFLIMLLRIILMGFLFGNMFSIIYSLCGGILSLAVMVLFKRVKGISMTGISVLGGVFHNVGQLLAAVIIVNNMKVSHYFPVLLISGVITGTLIGILASIIYRRVHKQC